MNKLYGIILAMAVLLVLSIGIALGVTYPMNNTISDVTNATQGSTETEPIDETVEPTETVTEPIDETVEPTETVTEPIEETVEPTETESKIPKETPKSPGFDIILVIGVLSMIYIFRYII